MNIKQAKAIPLAAVLERMGVTVSRQTERDLWYLSPLRDENTASFHVHVGKNVWYDFGEGRGGNTIDLVCAYLARNGEDAAAVDALRWLRNMLGSLETGTLTTRAKAGDGSATDAKWVLKRAQPIEHVALVRYLAQRAIPLSLAQKYLKEVYARNTATDKGIFALGFRNEDGGYELRNPFFKGAIAPKTISFVRGLVPKPEAIHVFEGFMDFLSAAADREDGVLDGDTIVLNSLSCLNAAFAYVRGYGYRTLYSWLDNDAPGQKATQALEAFCQAEEGLAHHPMNKEYAPHEDVNAWRMHRQKLSLSS